MLAELLGEDPDELRLELHDFIDRDRDDASGLDPLLEIEPAQRLASLLQDFATQFAVRMDLVSLSARARLLNAGWNMFEGPSAKFIDEDSRAFGEASVKLGGTLDAADLGDWPATSVPAFPSARIAVVPYGGWSGTFNVYEAASAGDRPVSAQGHADFLWDLYLTIGQDGRDGFAAYLGRATRLVLNLQASGPFAGCQAEFHETLDGGAIEEEGLLAFVANAMRLRDSEGEVWDAEIVRSEEEMRDAESDEDEMFLPVAGRFRPFLIEALRRGDAWPGHLFVFAGVRGIQEWLEAWLRFSVDGQDLAPEWVLDLADPGETDRTLPTTWHRRPVLARELERSLHDGSLERALTTWVEAYRVSLDELHQGWIAEAEASETRLRRKWSERLADVTGLAPDDGNATTTRDKGEKK